MPANLAVAVFRRRAFLKAAGAQDGVLSIFLPDAEHGKLRFPFAFQQFVLFLFLHLLRGNVCE